MSSVQPEGYLAMPTAGQGSPVLVLHAWWGLNETVQAFCRRLAEAGFVVFAPDLYHGKVTDQIVEAEALVTALDANFQKARAEVAEAVAFLKTRADQAGGVAVIGFSLGAFYALDLSASDPQNIRSVVLFYGTGPADFDHAQAEYIGHFAANDPFEPQSNVEELREALKKAGRTVTFYVYPSTGHWFFEPDRADAYDASAAELAWERTLAFLKRRFSQA